MNHTKLYILALALIAGCQADQPLPHPTPPRINRATRPTLTMLHQDGCPVSEMAQAPFLSFCQAHQHFFACEVKKLGMTFLGRKVMASPTFALSLGGALVDLSILLEAPLRLGST